MSKKIVFLLIISGVGVLGYLGIYKKAMQIQDVLTMNTQKTLALTEIKIDTFKVDGRDLHLEGKVSSEVARKFTLESIKNIEGLRKIDSQISIESINELVNMAEPNKSNIIGELMINFAANSPILSNESKKSIKRFLEHFNYNQSSTIRISGHSNAYGSKAGNILLSRERAECVKHFLISEGISPHRILTTGYSESHQITNNSLKSGQKNRRAELLVLYRED